MNQRIAHLLKQPESERLEFKLAKSALPRSLFETVCAFLNHRGGDILLGVGDDGSIEGIDPQSVQQVMKDCASLSNNPQKLDPPFILNPVHVQIDGLDIIHIAVPESSQVHRSKDKLFKRASDGDFKLTDPTQIALLVERKRRHFTENTIYPHLRFQHFDLETLKKARRLIGNNNPDHTWLTLSDEELLFNAGLYRQDLQTGESGYTLAAALLFGTEQTIQSVLPQYKIDALVRREDTERYDDRLNIRINLIDAYEQLIAFVSKHLSDKFYMEGEQRVSLRNKIFREIISNFLVHREFTSGVPAQLLIYADRVETNNASNPGVSGPIDPEHFSPTPKNPSIAKFFMQLGWVEELGSGVINVNHYLKEYAPGCTPEFIEGDVFKATIPISRDSAPQVPRKYPASTPQVRRLLQVMTGEMSRAELMTALGLKDRNHFSKEYLREALSGGWVAMTIPDKPNSKDQRYRISKQGQELKDSDGCSDESG